MNYDYKKYYLVPPPPPPPAQLNLQCFLDRNGGPEISFIIIIKLRYLFFLIKPDFFYDSNLKYFALHSYQTTTICCCTWTTFVFLLFRIVSELLFLSFWVWIHFSENPQAYGEGSETGNNVYHKYNNLAQTTATECYIVRLFCFLPLSFSAGNCTSFLIPAHQEMNTHFYCFHSVVKDVYNSISNYALTIVHHCYQCLGGQSWGKPSVSLVVEISLLRGSKCIFKGSQPLPANYTGEINYQIWPKHLLQSN